MEIFMIILGILIWGFGGFSWFYFQYQDKDMINKIKNENGILKNSLTKLQMETKEYYQQNLILKDKTSSLLTQNDDYNKIVGELNRYYFHLKNWYEKAKELTETLKVFDKDFENKMSRIGQYIPTISVDTSKLNSNDIILPGSQSFVSTSENNIPHQNHPQKPKQEKLSDYDDIEYNSWSNSQKNHTINATQHEGKAKVYISVDEDDTSHSTKKQNFTPSKEVSFNDDESKNDKKFF